MKKLLQLLSFVLLLALMQGCVFTSPSPEQNAKNSANDKSKEEESTFKITNLRGKNYVKGIVTLLRRDDGKKGWNYTIEGIETTNGKLPYVAFNHQAVLANEGDLVYATFYDNKLTEMMIIKAGYFKDGKRKEYVPPKKSTSSDKAPTKRDKAHQILSVPQEESVRL